MKWKKVRVCDTMKEAREVLKKCELASKGNGTYQPNDGLEVKVRIRKTTDGKFAIQLYLPTDFDEIPIKK